MKVNPIYYNNFGILVKDGTGRRAEAPHRALPHKSVGQSKDTVSRPEKKEFVNKIKEKIKALLRKNYVLNLSFHEKAKVYVIKIIDPSTNQVVREMPLEKLLDMVVSMEEAVEKRIEAHRHAVRSGEIKEVK